MVGGREREGFRPAAFRAETFPSSSHVHEMLIVLSLQQTQQGKEEGEDYGTRCLTRSWPNATTTATVLLTIPLPPVWPIERL